MNFNKLLKIFVPTDHSFFPLFKADIENLVKAAELLRKIMASQDPEERESIHREIKQLEHKGDEITNKTFEQLNKSFITPFDREDIHELVSNVDDVVDSINAISRRICLYRPREFRPQYMQMAELIYEASKSLELCIDHLEHAADKRIIILDACTKVNEIEHNADDLYFQGIHEIFEQEKDTKDILIHTKIIENLEKCVDEAEDVSDTIRTILIKMA
jgi:hypothetical protein